MTSEDPILSGRNCRSQSPSPRQMPMSTSLLFIRQQIGLITAPTLHGDRYSRRFRFCVADIIARDLTVGARGTAIQVTEDSLRSHPPLVMPISLSEISILAER